MGWKVYMLRCRNDALYTGITTDISRRLQEHNTGKGAKYTRLNGPVRLVYLETAKSHPAALRREYTIKSMKREEKLELLESGRNELVVPG